jgi:hypothetical protein
MISSAGNILPVGQDVIRKTNIGLNYQKNGVTGNSKIRSEAFAQYIFLKIGLTFNLISISILINKKTLTIHLLKDIMLRLIIVLLEEIKHYEIYVFILIALSITS